PVHQTEGAVARCLLLCRGHGHGRRCLLPNDESASSAFHASLATLATSLWRFAATLSFFRLNVEPRCDLSDQPALVFPDGWRPILKGQQDASAVGNVTRLRYAGFLGRNDLPNGFSALVVHHHHDLFATFDLQDLF